MRQVMTGILSVLFVVSLAGAGTAGMMDTMKGKADEAKVAATEAHKGMDMKAVESGKAIDATSATKEEAGGMMDQLKEGAKGEVNKTKEKTNETIDNIGK